MTKAAPKKSIKKISKTMSEKKSKSGKAVKVIKKLRVNEAVVVPKVSSSPVNTAMFVKILLIIAIGVVAFLLVQKNRSLFIVGTVNKSPVTRWELNSKMADKYAEQSFEEIVSERLLSENLKKNNITVSEKEINDELAKIKEQYGGEEQFKSALEQFGMTEAKALESIEQSIGLKKLVEAQGAVEISDAQVEAYFTDNKASYEGKELTEVSAEIKDILYQQEIYSRSQEWYSGIRKEAKINSYL